MKFLKALNKNTIQHELWLRYYTAVTILNILFKILLALLLLQPLLVAFMLNCLAKQSLDQSPLLQEF